MPEPEKPIPLQGGYRKLTSFQVARPAILESRTLAALRVPAAAKLVEAIA